MSECARQSRSASVLRRRRESHEDDDEVKQDSQYIAFSDGSGNLYDAICTSVEEDWRDGTGMLLATRISGWIAVTH